MPAGTPMLGEVLIVDVENLTTGQTGPVGTGNGTLTGAAIRTRETFTLTAIDATHFTVRGSSSGLLANATTGTPYVSPQVSFTLTVGGTAFVAGDKFTITATGAATWSEVTDMNSWDKSTDRTVREERVFNRVQPIRSPSTIRTQTWTLAGLVCIGDSGQDALNVAEYANALVNIRLRPDGTNGFTQLSYVTSYKHGAKPDGSFQDITYSFTGAADPIAVGAGWTLL